MNCEKIKFYDCICKSKLNNHKILKDIILNEIKNIGDHSSLNEIDYYYTDRISKLDWDNSKDFQRPWVKILLPDFTEALKDVIDSMGYVSVDIHNIWFQQYLENDTHGWHIHGDHFTGVYYLEYSNSCGKTQICSPYNLNKIDVDVQEGDIIVFPSHWIHRGMPNGKNRKTIISFNFDIISKQIHIDKIV
jgi:hypothetical protein